MLGLMPFKRRELDARIPDPLGLLRGRRTELAGYGLSPEIEYAFADGHAVELEFPIEDGKFAAIKPAVQTTFGTALDQRFIHGMQVVVQYELEPTLWLPTAVYIAGYRFNDTWSVMGMAGLRTEFGRGTRTRAEVITNLSLFAELNERWVAGIETNMGQVVGGGPMVLVMPQLHYEWTKHWSVQVGIGARLTRTVATPEAGFRFVRSF